MTALEKKCVPAENALIRVHRIRVPTKHPHALLLTTNLLVIAHRHLAEQEAEQYPKDHDRQDIGQQDR